MFGRRNREEKPREKVTRESLKEGLKVFEFVRPYQWYFWGGMLMLFASSVVFMVFPFLIGQLVDTANGEAIINFSLFEIGLVLLVALIFQSVTAFARVMLFAQVSEKATADIRATLYKKFVSLPVSFFEENKTGDLISRVNADVEKLYNVFSVTLAEFVRQIITLIVGIGFLAIATPRLSLVMVLTIPVVMVGAIFFGRFIRKISKQRQEILAETNSMLSESIMAISLVKAFVNEWFELNRYRKKNNEVVSFGIKYAFSRAVFAVFIILFIFGAIFFIIYQGVLMVQEGAMTSGNLISFVSYTFVIAGSIGSLGSFIGDLLGSVGATERVREILNTPNELELGDNESLTPHSIQGSVSFENVAFHYPTRTDVPVLQGLSFHIQPGEKIALVGSSGAGKSTIIQLLLRFYDIQSGDIKVDGQSIFGQELRTYRQNLALVPQEVILFGGTIRENILYGREDATEEEVISAAKQSNSWEFITKFPEGLDTIVGERGVKLSGGQRQRIAIARAILKDPAILLLDEATSSLDAESEKVVQEALDKLMEGRTSIIIAHRLSTIREVDCIYVLEKGVIKEKGTHTELSLLEDGIYKGLANLQFQ
ncbi:MAG: ABC transporter transmembrane domain-containing protein [Bacteroidota bacterium]